MAFGNPKDAVDQRVGCVCTDMYQCKNESYIVDIVDHRTAAAASISQA